MKTFKAVLFDLDGTLLNTLKDLADSINKVLSRMNVPVHPTAAYKYFVGDGIEKLASRVLPKNCQQEETIRQCIEEIKREYGAHWQDTTMPYDGIMDMLNNLKGKGLRLVILSNKPNDLTQANVTHFFGKDLFDYIAGAMPEIPKKPNPDGAIRIAETLGIKPEHFLYIGDTATDMKTALGAGMFPMGVLWGFRTAEELLENGGQVLVSHPADILKYI